MKTTISILQRISWIWNLLFQFLKKKTWTFFKLFKFKKLIWSKIWYLNSKLLFSILTINISIWGFKFKFKNVFDLKLEIAIPNYYFGFSELIFQFKFFWIDSKNENFNFESKNWQFNSEFLNLNSKIYFI